MHLFYNVFVRKHERGLLFKDGDFVRFLTPGRYRLGATFGEYTVQRFDISEPAFYFSMTDYLLDNERDTVLEHCDLVQTGKDEVAIVTAGLQRYYVLGPDQRALFWKDAAPLTVERFDLTEQLALPGDLATRLVNSTEKRAKDLISYAVYHKTVPEAHSGLLYVDGEMVDVLPAGLYAYWNVSNDVRIDLFDLRARSLEVQGQEILTRDKVALRVNVTASVRFVDPTAAMRNARDPMDQLYKAIQFGLRAAVGTRRLDTLLEDKSTLDTELSNYLEGHVAMTGLAVESIGVKDIILPGDMKMLMAQVVEAEKAAQANVIRRREETNATRSLLNTAKVMEGNPVALRLRELDTLEKVTQNVGTLSVSNGLEGLLKDLVRLDDRPDR